MKQSSRANFETSDVRDVNKGHSYFLAGLVFLNFFAFIAVIILNVAGAEPSINIFKNSNRDISNEHQVDITPASWTFTTWSIIYIWQGAWQIFNIVLVFKRDKNGSYLYREPAILTPLFHVFIFGNFAFNMLWLFMWTDKYFGVAFAVLALVTITLFASLVISHRNIYNNASSLANQKIYLVLYRALVNNGLAFYATWVTIATFVNLAIAITYEWGDKSDIANMRSTSAVIALSLLSVILLVYFSLDLYFFEKYLRFTFSPYLQLIIAFAGILSKQWSSSPSPSAVFSLILIIIAPGLVFAVKIARFLYYLKNN